MKKMALAGLLIVIIAITNYANESSGIFSYRIGQIEVFMIVESERDGNAGILIEADRAVLEHYIPAQGFRHTTNAFLVKTPEQNILIDTGTGAGGVVINRIKSLGVEPENIDAVLLTHLHGDHFGSLQNNGTANFPNAKIYLSARELEHFTKTSPNQGAVAALAPYLNVQSNTRVITFEPSQLNMRLTEILPGISPIAAYGHTPGHTIYQIESNGEKLLIAGDLLHVALVQFPVPQISATFDMDANAAASTRIQVLNYA
ncbi:MAG: MBL fold metallo-hydrolase, partial [Treponema sp.]|nr:MBL fold metallo-hydrolase [Treponema sp.]